MGSEGERINEQVRVMANAQFPAERRTVLGKKVGRLRREGRIPGIVYGPVMTETVPVTVDAREFNRFYQAHGHSTLFDLRWGDGVESVFIREVQIDPVRRNPLHVDFFAPNLRRPVRAMVPIVLHNPVNTAAAILTTSRSEVEVEALPAHIPHQIDVDVSGLENPGDALHIRDLVLPTGVVAVTDGDELVANMESIYQAPEEAVEEVVEQGTAIETEEQAPEE